jgi:hypothetical protein
MVPPGMASASARNCMASSRLREVSTDQGTTRALRRSDTPHNATPASQSERVVAKMLSPAARTAVSSLLRCSLLSTNSSESSIDSGSTTDR